MDPASKSKVTIIIYVVRLNRFYKAASKNFDSCDFGLIMIVVTAGAKIGEIIRLLRHAGFILHPEMNIASDGPPLLLCRNNDSQIPNFFECARIRVMILNDRIKRMTWIWLVAVGS